MYTLMIMTIPAVLRYRTFSVCIYSLLLFGNEKFSNYNLQVCNLEQQKCATVMSIGSRNKATSIAIEPKEGYGFSYGTSYPFCTEHLKTLSFDQK